MAGAVTAGELKGSRIGAILRSTSGNFLEQFDFFLFGFYASAISKAFFPTSDEVSGLLYTFGVFWLGALMRPVGAIVLGAYLDRVGRRLGLIVTLSIMASGTVLIAISPTYAQIGVLAPAIALIGRLLQGFSAGVELGGVSIYLFEIATPGHKGFYTSFQSASQQVAIFIAAIIGYVLSASLPQEVIVDWGWRIPFLLSAVLLAVSIWIRLKLNESPVFQKMKAEGKGSKRPLSEAFGQWSNAKIAILALFGATAGEAVVWYGGQFYALFFLSLTLKVPAVTAQILIAT